MKRVLVGVAVFAGALAVASAAPPRTPLEIWGVAAGDELTLDGAPVNVRTGGAPRVFTGDPDATNAPVLREVSPGKHELVLKRQGCAPRTFSITVEGSTKRAVVLDPSTTSRCAIPFAPPRR